MPKGNGKDPMILEKFYLPWQLVDAVVEVAERRGVSKSEFMRAILWDAVQKDILVRKELEAV